MTGRERGIAVAMTAGMLVFTVPIVGLAIDAGVLYGVRSKLSMAADAASIAAARSLAVGQTIQEQETNAIDTATRFFNANFPDNYLYTTNKNVDIGVAETGTRTRTVTVDARVTAPNYFLRFLGRNSADLSVTGKASRRDVNVMIVLDRSGSLQTSGACGPMKTAAAAFVEKFANYRDRLGLLTYGGDYRVDFPMPATPGNFQTGAGSIPSLIGQINCIGLTNTAQALWNAYGQIKAINEPGALNIILLFTDGQPNTLTFDFTNAMRTVARGYTGAAPTAAQTSQITTLSRSPCSSTTGKIGWVQYDGGSGRTRGLYKYLATALPANNSGLITNKAGCVFNMSGGTSYLYGDMGFMPPQDFYGNNVADAGYKTTLNITTAGSPDIGRIRINHAQTMENAGINATNHAASRIRNDETAPSALNTVIYTIGLGGVGAAEDELLQRVANTALSPIYDSTKQTGLYVYAPSTAQLSTAFNQIAGEILRIAR